MKVLKFWWSGRPWTTMTAIGMALALLLTGAIMVQAQSTALGPVFALRGALSRAVDQPYDTVLTTVDNVAIGLVGQTPVIEAEIVRLRNRAPGEIVKVWGIRYAADAPDGLDVIVVESILAGDAEQAPTPLPTATATRPATATATPTATPVSRASLPVAEVLVSAVNVRSGPGTDYAVIGRMVAGETCPVIGRNQPSTWYLLACTTGDGWVFGELVVLTGETDNIPTVTVAPPPTPSPTPTSMPTPTSTPQPAQVYRGWKSSFYANRDLRGEPAFVVDAPSLDFDWGGGSPGAGVPADNFSARFERRLTFPVGLYAIQATVDDGVRVYVDNQLVIDQWVVGSVRTFTTYQLLDGAHDFRVEYFEAGGMARIRLDVNLVSDAAAWRATYFDNMTLSGNPRLARNEPRSGTFPLDYDWGQGSPAPDRIPVDRWSARWTGTFYFDGGDYRFSANVDDGVRVYIDGILVLDAWRDGLQNNANNVFRNIGRGDHQIVVEYYENTGNALLRVWWDRVDPGGGRLRVE